ncbi:serine/threonine protein kinase [Enhygromyxa salina]|uniref:Serine/threonine-protein kinase PknL n=1 Tax=Enhygromyxa salina TaxID=215803 RepID=A0A2S9Y490_9BACT|nr:serine/threonine-protein kinase [Enhygromyxa salina]PRP99916.1 Serine/threonine-protein kinase PknL [Enhygromyxa salina]
MKAAEPVAPSRGEVVGEGRFELLSNLGEGGTSVVYRAHDCVEGIEVALKLLLPRYVGRPEREQRLINEAEYLRRLRGHPHIVEFVGAGRLEDRGRWPWLATEVLAGDTLDLVFVRGTLEIPRIIEIATQVADGLLACHAAGVVHRDATPSNLFMLDGPAGGVKLFDFSHAADLCAPQLAVGASGRLTGVHDVPGTLGYMGPEQVRQGPADPSMDVFGFGVLLFELVTRQNPYAHIHDRGAYIQGQREGKLEAPRLHAWAYGAPEELAELVHDCTKRVGAERPSMEEIIARLRSIRAAIGTSPTPAPDSVAVEAPEATVEMELRQAPTPVPGVPVKMGVWAPPGSRGDSSDAPDTTEKIDLRPAPAQVPDATVEMTPRPAVPLVPDATVKMTPRPAAPRVPDATVKMTPRPAAPRVPDATVKMTPRPAPMLVPDATVKMTPRPAVPLVPDATVEMKPKQAVPRVPDATVEMTPRPAPELDLDATVKMELRPAPELDPDATVKMELRPVPETTLKIEQAGLRTQQTQASIGAWGPPPTQVEVAEPPTTEPAPSPVAKAQHTEAPDQDQDDETATARLAFARPPQHRPTLVPVLAAEPVVEPAPPDTAQHAAEDPAEVEPDAPPLDNGRARIWWVALALLLLGGIGFVGWQRFQDPTNDVPVAAPPEPVKRDEPAVETVPELVPELAPPKPDVEPKPKPKPKPEVEPKPEVDPDPEPKPQPDQQPKPESDACGGTADQARKALADRDWRRALSLSANRKCWSSQAERAALRVAAFSELGEWSKCVEAGSGSTDPNVRAKVDGCRMFAPPETSP